MGWKIFGTLVARVKTPQKISHGVTFLCICGIRSTWTPMEEQSRGFQLCSRSENVVQDH